jgi:hypothetical protein
MELQALFLGPDMLDVQMDFVNLKEYAAVLGSVGPFCYG